MQQEQMQQPKKQNFFSLNEQHGQNQIRNLQAIGSNNFLQQRPPSQEQPRLNGQVKQKQFIYRKPQLLKEKQAPEEDNCFEITPQNLDEISLNDPIWKKILPDNIHLDEKKLMRLLDENPDYFYHNLGLCACYKCKCGRCKCDAKNNIKVQLNGAFQTVYDKDYLPRSNHNNITKTLNQKNYDTKFMNQKAIDLKSQYQTEFQEMPMESKVNFKEKSRHHLGSMSHLTSYRSNFNDWGSNYHKYSPYPHISTSPDIKFIGSSSYQNTYTSPNRWNLQTTSPIKSTLSPLPSGGFADTTTHKSSFKPFQVSQKIKTERNQNYQTIPTFEGQYITTEMNDYVQQNDDNCPAKKFQKIFRKQLAAKLFHKRQKSLRSTIAV